MFLEIYRTGFLQNTFECLLLEITKLALPYRSTPRLWYTFGPASITLDTKSVVKINSRFYNICNKTQKAQSSKWANTDIFLNKILDKK